MESGLVKSKFLDQCGQEEKKKSKLRVAAE